MYLGVEAGKLGLSEVEKLSSESRPCIAGPNSVRPEGLYFVAVEPNSFGIPSVGTCPGRTDYCELDCYAIESEKRTATHVKLQRNYDMLLAAETVKNMSLLLRELVETYKERSERLGIPDDKRRFRIHWSGDFFSEDYAQAWRNIILENEGIVFWTYTRSFGSDVNVLPILSGIPNLDLFASVDYQNVDRAEVVLAEHTDVKVAYLVDYQEEAAPLIDQLGRGKHTHRSLSCPENMRNEVTGKRKLPVISDRGGACSVCTYCIDKPDSWDVVFVKHGRVARIQGILPYPEPVEITRPPRRSPAIRVAGALLVDATQPDLFSDLELVK